jgi:MprA protease rhombosortase-interaction domain-containing protein
LEDEVGKVAVWGGAMTAQGMAGDAFQVKLLIAELKVRLAAVSFLTHDSHRRRRKEELVSEDLCQHPRPADALPKVDDAVRDILRQHHQTWQPRNRNVVIAWVWGINTLLALILAFLLGFFLAESQRAVTFWHAVTLILAFLLGFCLRRS